MLPHTELSVSRPDGKNVFRIITSFIDAGKKIVKTQTVFLEFSL